MFFRQKFKVRLVSPVLNLEPKCKRVAHSGCENIAALDNSLRSQICFKSLFVFVNLLVGDPHADIRSTNKRGRGKWWMSHVVLYVFQ